MENSSALLKVELIVVSVDFDHNIIVVADEY